MRFLMLAAVVLVAVAGPVARAQEAPNAEMDRAETELRSGGVVSVQVLNEFAAVAARKLKMSITDIRDVLAAVRAICEIAPITEETHDAGLRVAERYGLSVYDAMIVAAALLAECTVLVSEDMQNGQLFEGKVRVRDPFR